MIEITRKQELKDGVLTKDEYCISYEKVTGISSDGQGYSNYSYLFLSLSDAEELLTKLKEKLDEN